MRKRSGVKWIWIVLGVIAVLIVAFFALSTGFRNRMAQSFYTIHTVSTGNVEVSITGSGKLEPVDTETITLPDGIEVDEVPVKVGDVVEEGQVLAALNPESLRNRAVALTDEISRLDRQLAGMTNDRTTEIVVAPVSGRIKYLGASVNEDVTETILNHGSLALLSTDGFMQLTIHTDTDIELGTEVTVKWNDSEKTGEIASAIENGYRITLTDNGTPYGETASVYLDDQLLGEGVLQINKPFAVMANGGTIDIIHYKVNRKVDEKTKLFTLEHSLSNNYHQTYSQRQTMEEELQTVIGYIKNPFVIAESKGTIREANLLEGSTTGGSAGAAAGGSQAAAFVINKAGNLKMTVAVDELDIGSILPDQSAEITLDAMSSETFEAKVSRISHIGAAMGNIATYDVELTLAYDNRFLAGMNGNATIMIDKVEDVVRVPIDVINEDATGIYVYVSESGATDGSDRQRRDITTGLSDGEFAQVTNGLSKGDIVVYARAVSLESMFPGRPGGFTGGRPNGFENGGN